MFQSQNTRFNTVLGYARWAASGRIVSWVSVGGVNADYQPRKRTLEPAWRRREGRSLRKMRVVGRGPLVDIVGMKGGWGGSRKSLRDVSIIT